jgi:leucyl-tRNA synthetase
MHTVLKQVDYDYQRMQYNTVVSGAMKMLNALEDFKAGRRGRRRRAREGFGILLRVLYPATPHVTHACGSSWVTRRRRATCSTRPGRRSTKAR